MEESPAKTSNSFKNKFEIILCLIQAVLIILIGIFTEYKYIEASELEGIFNILDNSFTSQYSLFQHINVMIFIGFGFLMVFLKSHSWSSVGFTYLGAVIAIEVYIVSSGLWAGIIEDEWKSIQVNIELIVDAEFCAAAVLISFGAILGKASPSQLVVMAVFEAFIYTMNERIVLSKLDLVDIGGSISIHTFGAYFGLMVSWIISPLSTNRHPNNSPNYTSNTLTFIGTIFLWMYWPSFNAFLATGHARERIVLGTILSLSGSCISTFILSRYFKDGKMCMEDVLNASLSGGVVVGASACLMKDPYIPLLIGTFTGALSTWGFEKLSPFLQRKIHLYDTCGILNLHGMPGVLGGIVSIIVIGCTDDNEEYPDHSPGAQVGYQFASLIVTLFTVLITGALVGLLIKSRFFEPPVELFTDHEFWSVDLNSSISYSNMQIDHSNQHIPNNSHIFNYYY
jgi:ammonium transporter Rh